MRAYLRSKFRFLFVLYECTKAEDRCGQKQDGSNDEKGTFHYWSVAGQSFTGFPAVKFQWGGNVGLTPAEQVLGTVEEAFFIRCEGAKALTVDFVQNAVHFGLQVLAVGRGRRDFIGTGR